MTDYVTDYSRQSACSHPGNYGYLLDDLPTDIDALAAVVRNVVIHYRTPGIEFTGERLSEIDSRWIEEILAADQSRHPFPLTEPRAAEQRVAGCCRDYTLLTVAALRHRGVQARSRVGFATYFHPDFHVDHVIAEYHDGTAWRSIDAQTGDHDPAGFVPAAEVWKMYRSGEIDESNCGIFPGSPIGGGWFIRNYVILELAHRFCDETLLWESWDPMSETLDGDLALIDDIAGKLIAGADDELSAIYERVRPGPTLMSFTPAGEPRLVRVG